MPGKTPEGGLSEILKLPGAFDHDGFDRDILVHPLDTGLYGGNGVDDLHAFHHAAEDGISPTPGVFPFVVQEVIVDRVDEEL